MSSHPAAGARARDQRPALYGTSSPDSSASAVAGDRRLLGAAPALAYAQEHPERATEMIIPAATMTRPSEIYWLYEGARRLYPRHGTGSATRSPSTSETVTCWRLTRG